MANAYPAPYGRGELGRTGVMTARLFVSSLTSGPALTTSFQEIVFIDPQTTSADDDQTFLSNQFILSNDSLAADTITVSYDGGVTIGWIAFAGETYSPFVKTRRIWLKASAAAVPYRLEAG